MSGPFDPYVLNPSCNINYSRDIPKLPKQTNALQRVPIANMAWDTVSMNDIVYSRLQRTFTTQGTNKHNVQWNSTSQNH